MKPDFNHIRKKMANRMNKSSRSCPCHGCDDKFYKNELEYRTVKKDDLNWHVYLCENCLQKDVKDLNLYLEKMK